MLKLFVPRIWSSVVYHLSVLIDTVFASLVVFVGQGALASIYYANRLIQFPFAIIALSVSRVAIVDLSSYHRQGNMNDFKKLFVFSFQNIVFFITPIVTLFLFLSRPLIEVIFFRGQFSLDSLDKTSFVLFFYSFGLFFFCGIKLLVNAFYSLKDTKTPAKTATISLVANIILSAVLMLSLGIGGVALGTSLSAALNFFLLYRLLVKRIGKIGWQDTGLQIIKIIILSLGLGIISRYLWEIITFNKYLKLSIVLTSAGSLFVLGGYLIGLNQIHSLKKWILKRN
jgi:putative peptidoglycan lipid II flippase